MVRYRHNEDRLFVPASNAKLFTSALALARLGPNHRFQTRVAAESSIDSDGCLAGDLHLIGGGDPNLSGRVLPFAQDAAAGEPLVAFEALANQLVLRGLKRIAGDVVGNDTAYAWQPFPDGWAVDDTAWEYGAPVSALTFNDNVITVTVEPGEREGSPAAISVHPLIERLIIHNRVRSVEASQPKGIRFERSMSSFELILDGEIEVGGGPMSRKVAVDDPALFAAQTFLEVLRRRGIEVTGHARPLHRRVYEPPTAGPSQELATHTSLPLLDTLKVIGKVSQNLHSELVLREVARVRRGAGTQAAALDEMSEFLSEVGIDKTQYRLEDASGLSRLDLVTPMTVTKLLLHMYAGPYRSAWIDLLPVGGVDGTLADRFDAKPSAENVRAKTGSLSHVAALSGYTLHGGRPRYAFSVLVNHFNARSAEARTLIDKIALSLLNSH